jgi:surface antigen
VTTAAQVLALARKELGYCEAANNSNKYAKPAGHANNQPWCATFVVAMFRAAGMTLPSESAYTPAMANGFKKAGLWSANKPAVGAVVFYQWPKMGRIAHVGIVESVRPDGSIVTIEGNTNKAGSRTGGGVLRMVRRSNIAGYGLPRYAAGGGKPAGGTATTGTPACPGVTKEGMKDSPVTKAYQERLVARGAKIKADGDHGPKTTAALKDFQKKCGLPADGIGGPKTWDRLCAK